LKQRRVNTTESIPLEDIDEDEDEDK